LHPRRRIDVALHAVVMEAYVHGVSTRKVDDLVSALGAETGISESEVSRICGELDTEVAAFNGRDLAGQGFPYVFVDATYCKARVGGDKFGAGARVCSQAVVIATGVSADGRREVLGCAVGDSETEAFWTEFLRSLRERGLAGVALVISDHHRGLMNAIDATMIGTAWHVGAEGGLTGVTGRVRDGARRGQRAGCTDRAASGLLTAIERSPNTVKVYAHDLKDFFVFLMLRSVDWRKVQLEDIGDFVAWLRLPPAGRAGTVAVLPSVDAQVGAATVNRKLSAVSPAGRATPRPGGR